MSSSRSLGATVQPRSPTRAASAARHAPPRAARKKKPASAETGTLVLRVVSCSIRDAKLTGATDVAPPASFAVTVRPIGRGRSRPRKIEGPPFRPLKLRPGTYRVDVSQHVLPGQLQAYPDGACEAVIHPGKDTHAVVVLATDTLREVAAPCGFHIGTQVSPTTAADPAYARTVRQELNVVTIGVYWGSVHPALPGSSPPVPGPWNIGIVSSVIDAVCTGPHAPAILPTPLVWPAPGDTPAWASPHLKPSPAAALDAHVRTLMRDVKALGPVRQWVAVNEILNIHDPDRKHPGAPAWQFWEDLEARAFPKLSTRYIEITKRYLRVAHEADPGALLLVNDHNHELYPPSGRGAKGKLAREIATIRRLYPRTRPFHAIVAAARKDRALHGVIGAGYQMHFAYMKDYLANPALYRKALQAGMAKLRGVPVHVTEMAVSVEQMLPSLPKGAYEEAPGAQTPQFAAWVAARQALYAQHGYAATPAAPWWRSQARVYRDLVKTFLLAPSCKNVVFWGLLDTATDDRSDVYGHLFDSVAGTPGLYPAEGNQPGLNRKPAYFGVLNGLIDAGHAKHPHKVPNWLRSFRP